ncbi:MAG: HNH endonuclease [Actinomycetota bacterium]|nr:HNH endonuclease [Actinomycetota bacterium]
MHDRDDQALIEGIDALHSAISGSQRALFELIAQGDRRELWRDCGARDMAHWLSMRYGISQWKARRWIAAAHALEELPHLSRAFTCGRLCIDKVVELTRFATSETEGRLVAWAEGVSCACIRRKGDLAASSSMHATLDAEHSRFVSWWWLDDGRRFGLEAELPAAQGAVVARALQRLSERVPIMPGEDDACYANARRADALVALCSAGLGAEADADRATVIVHAQLEDLVSHRGGCELEGGGVIHPETARRLLCHGRVQIVIEDHARQPLSLGRISREPSAAMMRQLRYRDAECRFPGCGARRFTQAHHIVWWKRGGTTDLSNLVLVCTFHHKLVHEHGWALRRDPSGEVRWYRPDGVPYHAGPGPPRERDGRQGDPRCSTRVEPCLHVAQLRR